MFKINNLILQSANNQSLISINNIGINTFNCNSFGVGYIPTGPTGPTPELNNIFSSLGRKGPTGQIPTPELNNIFSSLGRKGPTGQIPTPELNNIFSLPTSTGYYYDLKNNNSNISNKLSNNFTINFNKINLKKYNLLKVYIIYNNSNINDSYIQYYSCNCENSSDDTFNSSQLLLSPNDNIIRVIPDNYILRLVIEYIPEIDQQITPEQLLTCVNSIDIVSYQ